MTPIGTAPLSSSANLALDELRLGGGLKQMPKVHGADLLLERALFNRYQFDSIRTAAGTCRLVGTLDGLLAVNLPREEDWQLVQAWIQAELQEDYGSEEIWPELAKALSQNTSSGLIERAHDLGLAVSYADKMPEAAKDFCQTLHKVKAGVCNKSRNPRVVDLSALWAGPLCSHLLALSGAEVIKVESTTRPDGARAGNAAFYGLLNQFKLSVALDFRTEQGLRDLRLLLSTADIVIESSRPRALLQLGIDPREYVENHPGLTWIQLTAHGSDSPRSHWIGYGDDAAAAAGLCTELHRMTGRHGFGGDAIADPLTGLYAALAAWRSWRAGGGELIGLSLREVTSYCIQREHEENKDLFERQLMAWPHVADQLNQGFTHTPRPCQGRVASLGEDTGFVLKEARRLSS